MNEKMSQNIRAIEMIASQGIAQKIQKTQPHPNSSRATLAPTFHPCPQRTSWGTARE
jgi:hypothetical protein